MNPKKSVVTLLVNAVLPGTEALRSEAIKVPIEDIRRSYALGYPTYDATHNDWTDMSYFFFDRTPLGTQQKREPPASQPLDPSVRDFQEKVFAADCLKSVDDNFYSETRVRWYWTSLDEAKHAVQLQEELDAKTLAKIPAEEQDSEGKFKLVRKRLNSSCNLLVRANMQAKLFVVTGESLKAIIQDKDLGSQVIQRWDGDMRLVYHRYCTWANALRLAFGVSCGRSMYEKIWVQCTEEIDSKEEFSHCLEDWNLDDGAAKLEEIPVGVNNEYMSYAVHVLQKAKGAAGMLIKYDNRDPQVAIWDMKQITLDEKEIIQEQADQN